MTMETCPYCLEHIEEILSGVHELRPIDKNGDINYKSFNKGDVLFSEGGIPRGVFFLHSGLIKIIKYGMEGKEQIIEIGNLHNEILSSVFSNYDENYQMSDLIEDFSNMNMDDLTQSEQLQIINNQAGKLYVTCCPLFHTPCI